MSEILNTFAPVIIPTLNRVDKLKACITSLESCTYADKTDVYISVDYPKTPYYQKGWNAVCDYLSEKSRNHKFQKLIVIKREQNLGIGHAKSNFNVTLDELREKYDRFIFTEDDNVFSPNFLEFLNKGLERFKDDKRICYLSGYNYDFTFPPMYKNNFYITKDGSPWGMGGWFDRLDDIRRYQNLDFLKNILLDRELYNELKKRRPQTIRAILHMLKVGHYYGDACLGCYVALEDKYWVLPTVSKVQNHGNDGSGAHTLSADKNIMSFYDSQSMDDEAHFDFTDDIFTYRPIELKGNNVPQKWYKEMVKTVVAKIDLFCLRYFGFIPKSKYI